MPQENVYAHLSEIEAHTERVRELMAQAAYNRTVEELMDTSPPVWLGVCLLLSAFILGGLIAWASLT